MKGCKGLAGWLCGLSFAVMAAPQDDAPVSLAFHDAPVALVLQALADHQQLNLVTAESVSGTLTLRLEAVPWRQALAVILRMGKLGMTLDGKVMTVFPAEQLPPPLQTLTQRLHHAEAAAVLQSLQAQRGALLSERGSVMADPRTNTLMIRDEASALKLLAGWLQQMDQPLEQVQLAAHIVTIGSEDLHELGVSWGLAEEASPGKALRLDNFSVGLPLERSAISAGFHLARISGRILDLELTALEQENALEIIAS
ncbi:TPA: type IV pilus secretin PilQ, partial [Serratia rubidaea]|nr:type IV pilus secretin PilQ [Serratia rubidaea]